MSAPDVMVLRTVDQHPVQYDKESGTFLFYGFPMGADTAEKLGALVAGGYVARRVHPDNPVDVVLTGKGQEAIR